MIEKLESKMECIGITIWGHQEECLGFDSAKKIVNKINELVDAVNELQLTVSKMENLEHLRKIGQGFKKLNDPYAEQRKWIGCLCRFWNFKDGAIDIGILKAVDNLKPTIPYINDIDCSYAFCEPVKPDDDIIYKQN